MADVEGLTRGLLPAELGTDLTTAAAAPFHGPHHGGQKTDLTAEDVATPAPLPLTDLSHDRCLLPEDEEEETCDLPPDPSPRHPVETTKPVSPVGIEVGVEATLVRHLARRPGLGLAPHLILDPASHTATPTTTALFRAARAAAVVSAVATAVVETVAAAAAAAVSRTSPARLHHDCNPLPVGNVHTLLLIVVLLHRRPALVLLGDGAGRLRTRRVRPLLRQSVEGVAAQLGAGVGVLCDGGRGRYPDRGHRLRRGGGLLIEIGNLFIEKGGKGGNWRGLVLFFFLV